MEWYVTVLLIVLGFILLSLIIWPLIALYFFNRTIPRSDGAMSTDEADKMMGTHWGQFTDFLKERKAWMTAQSLEHITVTSKDGLKLSGDYLENDPKSKRLVIAFHGYRSKGLNEYSAFAEFYSRIRCNMLIVDERGHGDSEGEYIGFGVLDRWDAVKWIEYAVKRFGSDCEIILHGISMGASTVLMASSLDLPKNVKCIVADCAFTNAYDVFAHVLKAWYHMPKFPILNLAEIPLKKKAGYGYRDCSTLDSVSQTDIPVLFIHGGKDTFVPTWMSRENYKACVSPKELLIVDDASHGESYFMETERCEKAITELINKYCD